MGFSKLVTGTIRAKYSNTRKGTKVDSVAIHTMSGKLTGAQCGNYFASIGRVASSNYGIGYEGDIYGYVDEDLKSMCTSNSGVDRRAITIEVASTMHEPYEVTDAAYESLIRLLVDICQRHNMTLRWANDKAYAKAAANGGPVTKQNMFVHRWFNTSKSCPGDYLFKRHSAIAAEVNKRLLTGGSTATSMSGTGGIEGKNTVIFIGDSRTIGMKSAAGTNSNIWSLSATADYTWLKSAGVPYIENKVTSSTAVCIMVGINDLLTRNPGDYSNFINQCANKWSAKGASTYFVSINPVGTPSNGTYKQITNDKIVAYNQKIRDGLSSNVGYIDTYSQIVSNYNTTDGLRFDKNTYSSIYQAIVSAVHSGQAGAYCDSSTIGGMPIQIDYTKLNSYVITLDRFSPDDLDYDKLKEKGVVGAVIEGGYLYYPNSTTKVTTFKQPKFDTQKKIIESKNLEWGFFFPIRSRTLSQAVSEMYEITLMLRHYPCRFGVWLKPEFSKNQVAINDQILQYFQKQLIKQGFMSKIGLYVTKDMMKTFTWNKFKDLWLLWIVDHVKETSDIQKLLDPSFFDMDGDNANDTINAANLVSGVMTAVDSVATSVSYTSSSGGSVAVNAMNWMVHIAEDNSHGYSQQNRWGPDYDCSSLVVSAYEKAGVAMKSKGIMNSSSMTDSNMRKAGFTNVTSSCDLKTGSGMQQGDVLWRSGHVAMYIGNGRLVEASSNRGHPQAGDQTGTEIKTDKYRTGFTKVFRHM